MALPPPITLPVVIIESITQAERAREGRQVGAVAFQLEARTSLANAAELDLITMPGSDGFVLVNKELLDCKKRTKIRLERAYEEMYDSCMRNCDEEIHKLDNSIHTLKEKIAVSNDNLDPVGPPEAERNQGPQHVVKLLPVLGAYPSYEMAPPIPFLPPYSQPSDRQAAIGRDHEAYKEWLELDLRFLEKRRQIAEENKVSLERGLKAVLKDALVSRSMLGAGYHKYDFEI